MKILIIDGQGGRMGGLLAEKIKKAAIRGLKSTPWEPTAPPQQPC